VNIDRVSGILRVAAALTVLAGLVLAAMHTLNLTPDRKVSVGLQAAIPLLSFLTLSVIVVFFVRGAVGFLLGIFTFLIGWRVAALSGLTDVILILAAAFSLFLFWFVSKARSAVVADGDLVPGHRLTGADVHLTFFRLYLGLDLVPHFTEKLFAGPATRSDDVAAFTQLGVPDPQSFVLLAGVVEFAGSLGVGLGLFTRLAAVCLAAYLMIATVMGDHFAIGFIWASPGGGWEYPVLWTVLILSFAVGGGHWLSLDQVIRRHAQVPAFLSMIMSGRGRA